MVDFKQKRAFKVGGVIEIIRPVHGLEKGSMHVVSSVGHHSVFVNVPGRSLSIMVEAYNCKAV